MNYKEAQERYHFQDSPSMRKRWDSFIRHKKECRERSKRLHALFNEDRLKWKNELIQTGATPAEIRSFEARELKKNQLYKKLYK